MYIDWKNSLTKAEILISIKILPIYFFLNSLTIKRKCSHVLKTNIQCDINVLQFLVSLSVCLSALIFFLFGMMQPTETNNSITLFCHEPCSFFVLYFLVIEGDGHI